MIISLRNNAIISGDYGENFELINYSYIRGNAQLEQIEQGSDTLIIYSEVMEATGIIRSITLRKIMLNLYGVNSLHGAVVEFICLNRKLLRSLCNR